MADDIDIEEHDILLNPRMKDYLSSLQIKKEPTDIAEKDEIQTDDATDDSEGSSAPSLADTEDVDHSGKTSKGNKLILGSKLVTKNVHHPCLTTPSTTVEEYNEEGQRPEDAYVYLEDWAHRLDSSPCYCKECAILFATRNALDAHKMAAHSFLVAMATGNNATPVIPVPVNKGTLCKHCNTYFEDEGAIIKHMYEMLEGKKTEPAKVVKKNERVSEIAPAKKTPIAIKHTARKSEPSGLSQRVSETAKSTELPKEATSLAESVYSCPMCSYFYKNLNLLKDHVKRNHGSSYRVFVLAPFQAGCKLCHRQTSFSSHNKHIKADHQDQYLKKVEDGNKNPKKEVSSKKSSKTAKTDDKNNSIVNHLSGIRTYVGKRPIYKCTDCNTTYINHASARVHNRSYHPNKNTLLYIGPAKPVHRSPKCSPLYKKIMPKNVLFRCTECSMHFLSAICAISHSSVHANEELNKKHDEWSCLQCNRKLRSTDQKFHKYQHKFGGEIQCFDYHDQIYSRVLCRCAKCDVYFEERLFYKHYLTGCDSTTVSQRCAICDVNVNQYSTHNQKHAVKQFLKSDFIFIRDFITNDLVDESDLESKNQSQLEESETQDDSDNDFDDPMHDDFETKGSKRKLPENSTPKSKKLKTDSNPTESLNILYNCGKCNLTSNSYDDAIEHCQMHINKDDYKPNMRNCSVCFMNFESACLNDHKSAKKLKVLTYNYEQLFSAGWLRLFSSVAKDEVKNITANSKYVTRAIKMNLILDGLPNLTMYKCESCKNYVDKSMVFTHTHTCDGTGGNFPCESCGVKFSCADGLNSHQKVHEDATVTANSYRIVAFNNKSDKHFNAKLKEFFERAPRSEDEFEDNETRCKASGKSEVKFYQCQCCQSCSQSIKFVNKHKCHPKEVARECTQCVYMTTYHAMSVHTKWHEENPYITERHIEIVPFANGSLIGREAKKFYRCKSCKLILVNKYHKCGESETWKCEICKYTFPLRSKKYHLLEHRVDKHLSRENMNVVTHEFDKDDYFNKNFAVDTSDTFYKCASCKKHFAKKLDFCCHRRRNQCFTNKGHKCNRCGLIFHAKAFSIHKLKHRLHRRKKGCVNLNVVTLSKAGMKDYTLYKCEKCKIHFVSRATIRLHFKRGHKVTSKKNCSKCNLRFWGNDFPTHSTIHHGAVNYKADEFNVVTVKQKNKEDTDVVDHTEEGVRRSRRPRVPKKSFGEESSTDDDSAEVDDDSTEVDDDSAKVDDDSADVDDDSADVDDNSAIVDDDETDIGDPETASGTVSIDTSEKAASKSKKTETEKAKNVNKKLATFVYNKVKYDRTVHKCLCGLHFLTLSALNDHWKMPCDKTSRISNSPCPKCDYVFTRMTLPRHVRVQHEIMNLDAKDLIIKVHQKSRNEISKGVRNKVSTDQKTEANKNNSLYQCAKCKHHYLTRDSINAHLLNNHVTFRSIEDCTVCGLAFTSNTLTRHKFLHHDSLKLSLEDLHIFKVTGVYKKNVTSRDNSIESGESEDSTTESQDSTDDTVKSLGKRGSNKSLKGNAKKVRADRLRIRVARKLLSSNKSQTDTLDSQSETERESYMEIESDNISVTSETSESVATSSAKDKEDVAVISEEPESQTEKIAVNDETPFSEKRLDEEKSDMLKSALNTDETVEESSKDDVNETNSIIAKDDSILGKVSANETTLSNEAEQKEKENLKLYKCGDCNVYFIDQKTCYDHTAQHTPLDPYDYIECKLCTLQFQIEYLKKHIQKHHSNKDFHLDKVLVEEYQPSEVGPKKDVYLAIDKVQSLLVSTTTDDREAKKADTSTNVIEVPTNSKVSKTFANDAEQESISKNSTKNLDSSTNLETANDVSTNLGNASVEVADDTMVTVKTEVDEDDNSGVNKDVPSSNDVKASTSKTSPQSLKTYERKKTVKYICRFCGETFNNCRAKELHESLDHLDAMKECPFCKKSFNASILNELHLSIANDEFTCCLCNCRCATEKLVTHSAFHNDSSKIDVL